MIRSVHSGDKLQEASPQALWWTLKNDLPSRWNLGALAIVLLMLAIPAAREPVRLHAPLLLLPLVLWALRQNLKQVRASVEKGFWKDLSRAALSWFGLAAIDLALWHFSSPPAMILIGEAFRALGYVFLVLALERQPHRQHRWRPVALERRLTWPPVSLAISGLFAYFLLLPAATATAATAGYASVPGLFLVLDTYLLIRLLLFIRATDSPRWRSLYILIIAAVASLFVHDLLDFLRLDLLRQAPDPDIWSAFRGKLPLVWIALAARARHHRFPHMSVPIQAIRLEENLPGPLAYTMFFAVLFPWMHYAGYQRGLFAASLEEPRERLVFAALLLLGGLAAMQYRWLARTTTALRSERSRVEKGLAQMEKDLRVKTEQKKALAVLQTSSERFARAFHACPDVMALVRLADGCITDINQGSLELFGLEPREIIGRSSRDLRLWEDLEDRERIRRQLKKGGTVNDFEAVFRKKSGEPGYALLSAAAIELEGEPFVFTILRDMSRTRRVRDRHERRRAAIERAGCAIWAVDTEGRLTFWNRGAQRLFGWSAQEAARRNAATIGDDKDFLSASIAVHDRTGVRRSTLKVAVPSEAVPDEAVPDEAVPDEALPEPLMGSGEEGDDGDD
jgi:PAS domain S-box-containing protein